MKRAFITQGIRTAFTRANKGALAQTRPDDLLAELFKSLLSNNKTGEAQEVIIGCAYPEGEQGYNIARMAALGAGVNLPGLTVNRLCASSLEAVLLASHRVKLGMSEVVLTGGVESMSRITRRGAGFSESEAIANVSPKAYVGMGDTAEYVAGKYPEITREIQEEFSARSHELAFKAYEAGYYERQIQDFAGRGDEGIRYPVNREKMSTLKPAFQEDGSVTAATSSPLSDGACAALVVSEECLKSAGEQDGIEIIDAAVGAVEPELMGLGPVPATRTLLKRQSLEAKDIRVVEMNEAFAVQVLACNRELSFDPDTINCWGGAIAIGHPLGASGLRLAMTVHDRLMSQETGSLGLATLCVGGGQGLSVLFRKTSL